MRLATLRELVRAVRRIRKISKANDLPFETTASEAILRIVIRPVLCHP
jgi:hypothetical protein